MSKFPPIMPEEYWKNSQLSGVRHFGRIDINGEIYVIVDKRGWDIFRCSQEAERCGREMAIEPGEPCDLVNFKYVPAYAALGRDRIIALVQEGKTLREINEIVKTEAATKPKRRK